MSMDTLAVDKPWLMLGDCLERMAEIPDGSVDMIACDLPYGTTNCRWDAIISFEPLWEHYRRVIKGNGAIVLTSSQPFTSALVMSNLKWFKYCWVWQKTRPGDIFNAKNKPMKYHEDVCVFSSGTTANGSSNRMPYFPQGVGLGGVRTNNPDEKEYAFKGKRPSLKANHVTHGSGYPQSVIPFANPNKGSLHPTQKPVPLFEYLIRTYTNPSEIILDNCFGSGTTGVACVNTGRRFIGIERDPHYFDVGRSRIEAAIAAALQPAPQGGLFDSREAAD